MAKRSSKATTGSSGPATTGHYTRPSRQAARQRRTGSTDMGALFTGAAWLGIFFVLAGAGLPWLVAWVIGASIATLGAFWWDKQQARTHGPRFRERDLLLFTALGGYLGAAIGMAIFRHKTLHRTFVIVLVLAALGWTATLVSILLPR